MSSEQVAEKDAGQRHARLHRDVLALFDAAERSCLGGVRVTDYPDPDALSSARNFTAYLGVRRKDIRELQRDLHRIGISSLGRIETHALDSLASVSTILARLSGNEPPEPAAPRLTYDAGERILARRTEQLLGPRPAHGSTRIMVTMPAEAAHYGLVRDLVVAGMQVARINCAHDDANLWQIVAKHVRRAAHELNSPCKVVCDLPGPKLRTGPVESGPGVIRWHAFKDPYGKVIAPARIWITDRAATPPLAHATLPVNTSFLVQLRPGDEIHFHDHQGRQRWVMITETGEGGVWAEANRGAFMVAGISIQARRGEMVLPIAGTVGDLPPMPRELMLKAGDRLRITPDDRPGRAPGANDTTARIGCSLPEVFADVQPGQRVFIDDGRIAGVIDEVGAEGVRLRIVWVRGESARLTEDKGINLPDSPLRLPPLTAADLAALDFAAAPDRPADAVGLSFVRHADDVDALYRELDRRQAKHMGVILKIETATAFRNLPGILLSALRRNRVGVMIARGDLGVEVGFERMAELQEEIGSLCAAAHLPVIWATQVLESLAKKGMPSRAEVSDVVLAARTQCVMLNKGPHLAAAVRFLADVLRRMEGHQDKHFRLMRALKVASR